MSTRLVIILALFATACSDDEKELPNFETLFPAANEISSYAEAPVGGDNVAAGPEISTVEDAVWDMINGGAEPFFAQGFVSFGREFYTNGNYAIELRLWQMKTAAGAEAAMTEVTTGGNWVDASFGDAARMEEQSVTWYWHIRKGVYEMRIASEAAAGGAGTHAGAEGEGGAFATAVLSKMP